MGTCSHMLGRQRLTHSIAAATLAFTLAAGAQPSDATAKPKLRVEVYAGPGGACPAGMMLRINVDLPKQATKSQIRHARRTFRPNRRATVVVGGQAFTFRRGKSAGYVFDTRVSWWYRDRELPLDVVTSVMDRKATVRFKTTGGKQRVVRTKVGPQPCG